VRNRSDASGTEIERHAAYVPGDDLRRIDWNTYARLGELFTRRYVAEREVPVWIAIDTSGSMGPATPGSKLDMACAVAAIFATVALAAGDRIYLAAIPGTARAGASFERCGPLRGHRSLPDLRAFLQHLAPSDGPGNLAAGLADALRSTRRGVVIAISDFLFERGALDAALDAIVVRPCEGKLVQVLSREDRDPSWLHGRDTLLDRETGVELHIEPSHETWQRYETALAAQIAAVAEAAARRAMTSAMPITDEGLHAFLRTELPRLGLSLVR
jgi:uncharacterized protein (DUF58 family)